MTRYYLVQTSVEGFRGINNEGNPLTLKFKPGSVNSVFAPNGTGKSSLFEALHYAIRGEVPRLAKMQAADKPNDYVANLFHSKGESTIELVFASDDGSANVEIEVKRLQNGERSVTSASGQPDPEAFLSSLNEDFALLDYSTFTAFIEDTALERGRSFSALLGLSAFGNVRRALRLVENTQSFKSDFGIAQLEAQCQAYEREQLQCREQFDHQYLSATELPTDSDASKWKPNLLKALSTIPLIADQVADNIAQVNYEALQQTVLHAEGNEDRNLLLYLAKQQADLAGVPEGGPNPEQNAVAIQKLIESVAELTSETLGAHFHKLQGSAREFLSSDASWDQFICPLCSSRLGVPIAETVDEHLGMFMDVEEKTLALNAAVLDGHLLARLAFLEAIPELSNPTDSKLSFALRAEVGTGTLKADDITGALTRISELEKRLSEKKLTVAEDIKEIEVRIPVSLVNVTARIAAVKAASEALTRRETAQLNLTKVKGKLDLFNKWKTFLNQALRIFSNAETDLSQKTLDSLRVEYQEMFAQVMSAQNIVPELSRGGNQEQLAVALSDFHGQTGVSAQALLSESYRNALAISVFLSAAVKHTKTPRFIVLDDATSSFDSGHQFQLMEQIRTRFQQPNRSDGLQFIVFSHDVTLEKYFDRLSAESDWNHQKLQGWPPFSPVSSHGQQPDRLRIEAQALLQQGKLSEGAGLIRQHLEFTLLKVIRELQIPVPIDLAVNDHSKMVNGCLNAILYSVNIHKEAGQLVMTDQQVQDLKMRHSQAIIANWISHHGTSGSSAFTPPSLLGVINSIDDLSRCFQFEVGGTGSGEWRFYKSMTKRN